MKPIHETDSNTTILSRNDKTTLCPELIKILDSKKYIRGLDWTQRLSMERILEENEKMNGGGMVQSVNNIDMNIGGYFEVLEDVNSPEDVFRYMESQTLNGALILAAKDGKPEAVKQLLEGGADVNSEYGIPLCLAVANGHHDVAKLLIENGADVNAGTNIQKYEGFARFDGELTEDNWSIEGKSYTFTDGVPLRMAAQYGDVAMIQLLVDSGADINAGMNTALYHAAREGHLDSLNLLIKAGADVDAGDFSPLLIAIIYNNPDIIRSLAQQGADVNYQDGAPLMKAALLGHMDAVEILIEHGAEPTIEAVEAARRDDNEEVAHFIYSHYEKSLIRRHMPGGDSSPSMNPDIPRKQRL
ncbi:MAG: hypothetical protein B7X39_14125 [Lysobacterales bacterium 14-68-21]|jgi:ankyrin repeat protein|nr:MAG: hypothetical protein B7X45_13015 [Xanthomonadales bacterium 15-68-25]OZB65383.1 MAG: hypothetical protein B7X39_14125 [Xanthomonadales bacterium 14-68-21]